jgi:hypothetical protein
MPAELLPVLGELCGSRSRNSRGGLTARGLLALETMLLRSKGHHAEEIFDEPLPELSDEVTRDDVFPDEGRGTPLRDGFDDEEEDDGEEPDSFLASLPGPLFAAATFVPTFLAVFFGLSYLLSGATPSARTAAGPAPSAVAPLVRESTPAVPPGSEAARDPIIPPRLLDPFTPAPREPSVARPSDPPEAPRESRGTTPHSTRSDTTRSDSPRSEATRPAVEPAAPSLPPVQPRATVQRPERPAAPPTPAPEPPAARPAKGERDWTPAAAFTDREAAGRLAGSIKQQGYPVEIRQDPASSRPWVVWIGAQPRSGERRR